MKLCLKKSAKMFRSVLVTSFLTQGCSRAFVVQARCMSSQKRVCALIVGKITKLVMFLPVFNSNELKFKVLLAAAKVQFLIGLYGILVLNTSVLETFFVKISMKALQLAKKPKPSWTRENLCLTRLW